MLNLDLLTYPYNHQFNFIHLIFPKNLPRLTLQYFSIRSSHCTSWPKEMPCDWHKFVLVGAGQQKGIPSVLRTHCRHRLVTRWKGSCSFNQCVTSCSVLHPAGLFRFTMIHPDAPAKSEGCCVMSHVHSAFWELKCQGRKLHALTDLGNNDSIVADEPFETWLGSFEDCHESAGKRLIKHLANSISWYQLYQMMPAVTLRCVRLVHSQAVAPERQSSWSHSQLKFLDKIPSISWWNLNSQSNTWNAPESH